MKSVEYQVAYDFCLQPSTAGDVSNSESDECEPAEQSVPQSEPAAEPVERWRSFSEGEQVRVCKCGEDSISVLKSAGFQ